MASKGLYPYLQCSVPGYEWLWAVKDMTLGPDRGFFPCTSYEKTVVSQIETKVCDESWAGTDSAIQMRICRDGLGANATCCTTDVFDKNGDDFERGDFDVYAADVLGACAGFEIGADTVDVSVVNLGEDGVCFDSVNLRTGTEGQVMRCYIPNQTEYWADSGTMDLRCERF